MKTFAYILVPILSGVLLGASQPLVISTLGDAPLDPTGLSGLLCLIGYVPLFLLIERLSPGRAFFAGLLTGVVQHAIILYWFVIAMHVFGDVAIIWSVATLLFSASIIGSYMGAGYAMARVISQRFSWPMWVLLPPAVTSAEYMLNFILVGGFPWANVSHSLAAVPVLLQSASVVGSYGLVFFVVLVNASLAAGLAALMYKKRLPRLPLALSICVVIAAFAYGSYRLNSYEHLAEAARSIKVALLQGNIEQGIKNKAVQHRDFIINKFRTLQDSAVARGAQLVIWPEASMPRWIAANDERIRPIGAAAPATIMGAMVYDDRPDASAGKMRQTLYNSALLLDENYAIKGHVSKTHLVPFGEYVPWPFEHIVQKVVPGLGFFGRGAPSDVHEVGLGANVPPVKVGVTICYEGIFPEISRGLALAGAELLVNLTNDAWYGVSSAPYQHLNQYRLRAVENGRSYVRATNTGISAVVDARGRTTGNTPLYEDAAPVIDVPLVAESTLYLAIGDLVAQLSATFIVGAFMIALLGTRVLMRRRSKLEWAVAFVGYATVAAFALFYSDPRFALDESAATKLTLSTFIGLAVGTGALSGKTWGASVVFSCGVFLMLASAFFALFAGAYFLIGVGLGLVLVWLSRQIKHIHAATGEGS
jgi:apolipoprotein N-acyltransferase